LIRLGILLLVAGLACRARPGYFPPAAGSLAAAYPLIRADGEEGRVQEEDTAQWECELASAALCAGAEEDAFNALHAASRTMGTLESTSGEAARAILGQEATKVWRGDPYERCMNALYKGLLYWRRGDLGNASACFRRGLLADGYSEAGEFQRDFAVLAYLLGWVSYKRGRADQARFNFREALQFEPENPYFIAPEPEQFNVLAVVDIGRGPRKFATGPGGSEAYFEPLSHPEAAVEILVDGQSAGLSWRGVDLFYQAVTRGEMALDSIRKGKAILKTASGIAGVIALDQSSYHGSRDGAIVGASLLLFSLLVNAEADVRHWSLLPAEVQVLPLSLAPGSRVLEVRAVDADGKPLAGWSKTFRVEVPPGRDDLLYYFRTGNATVYGLTDPVSGTRR